MKIIDDLKHGLPRLIKLTMFVWVVVWRVKYWLFKKFVAHTSSNE